MSARHTYVIQYQLTILVLPNHPHDNKGGSKMVYKKQWLREKQKVGELSYRTKKLKKNKLYIIQLQGSASFPP
uniref:Uncharacterized protein n=1 Tax=Anguilla anguilla TaxID=7936 RepID=A0A0E9XGV8_ANGAN